MIKFTFLVENKTYRGALTAEAGLSIFIDTEEKKILFDAGVSNAFAENAENKGIDLSTVDLAVVSHGHYDHTGGFRKFCELNETAPIYISWEAFGEFYSMHGDKIAEKPCGIKWTEGDMAFIKPRIKYTGGVEVISEDIVISGFVPPVKKFEPVDKFYIKEEDGYREDDMAHEQFLIVRDRDESGRSKGIYIFSGCSHKGVVSVLQYAKEMFPYEKIAGFIAGMHLCGADENMRKNVADELEKYDIKIIMPVHCTGMDAIIALREKFGPKCVIANTGDSYEY